MEATETNKISRIKVKNLFGLYNYDFDLEPKATLLHALNGGGKTTIMKLIKAVLLVEHTTIHDIIFESFCIWFSNGSQIKVDKDIKEILRLDEELGTLRRGEAKRSYEPFDGIRDNLRPEKMHFYHEINKVEKQRNEVFLNQKAVFSFIKDDQIIQTIFIEQWPSYKFGIITDMVKEYSENMDVHFISAGRLYDINGNGTLGDSVSYYNDLVSKAINQAMRKPRRLLLNSQSGMTEFGLELADISDPYVVPAISTDEDPVYEFYVKVRALKGYLDNEFKLPNKQMFMDVYEHFIYFITDLGGYVPAESLSSGEKNLFVLILYLLFYCKSNSIVLLDEPEISMHISWQMDFVNVILSIIEQNGFQAIIPTHSPNIINNHWDITIGLGEDEDDDEE